MDLGHATWGASEENCEQELDGCRAPWRTWRAARLLLRPLCTASGGCAAEPLWCGGACLRGVVLLVASLCGGAVGAGPGPPPGPGRHGGRQPLVRRRAHPPRCSLSTGFEVCGAAGAAPTSSDVVFILAGQASAASVRPGLQERWGSCGSLHLTRFPEHHVHDCLLTYL